MGKQSYAVDNSDHKVMKKQRKGIDMINQLPDELLIRILSLLPDADATRSRILSNRWKHLWVYLPNLHFVMPLFEEQAKYFSDSVDQILALRARLPIRKFFLEFSYYNSTAYGVNNWLRIVSQRKVEELDFRFRGSLNDRFFWNLFRTNMLKGSTVLVDITFPCLKKMNLQYIAYFDTDSLTNLLSRCPVLEELCLDELQLSRNLYMVELSSPSMRRLTIKRAELIEVLLIDAPKLEYLHLMSCCFEYYIMVNPTSLVEANISNKWSSNIIQLLTFVSSTKILTLTRESSSDFGSISNILLPMFPNLIKLEFNWEWSLLLDLLNNMPNLEYLSIPDGFLSFKGRKWNPPKEEAPDCLQFKLKEIFIVSCATREDFAIISYLLKHANILEKLTISEDDPGRRKRWLNIHCVSKSCQIEFV